MSKSSKKPQPTTTPGAKPQLLQPRTMRFAADEICANTLRIAPVGQYDAWAEWQYTPENPAITDAWAVALIAESATWDVPPPRGREWAQQVARKAIEEGKKHE